MFTLAQALLANPGLYLYASLALVYVAAAVTARAEGHGALVPCYSTSAVLHGLLGVSHGLAGAHG